MIRLCENSSKKTWKSIKNAPAVKGHLDFIAVIISIVLSTLLLLQTVRNLHGNQNTQPTPTVTQKNTFSPTKIVVATPTATSSKPTLPPEICKKGLAQTTIDSPEEGDTVTSNPVCVAINYHQGDFCSAVWRYQINNGQWSNFDNDSPCIYNLPSGQTTVTVKVKSLVTSDTQTLTRHFLYQSTTATSSASTQ